MDHKVTTDYTRLLGNANVKVRICSMRACDAWWVSRLKLTCIWQVYVRARPCDDGQKPPEDMFERNRDTQKNIVIKVQWSAWSLGEQELASTYLH